MQQQQQTHKVEYYRKGSLPLIFSHIMALERYGKLAHGMLQIMPVYGVNPFLAWPTLPRDEIEAWMETSRDYRKSSKFHT